MPLSSISTHPFLMFPLFQKYLNPQVRANKMVNSVVYHPCPSKLGSRIHTFIFLNSFRALSKILVEFPLTFIFHHVWEKYLNFGVCIPRKCIQPRHFYSCPRFSKFQEEFFENLFPATAERGGENYDLLYQNSIRKYEDDLEHEFV